MRSKKRERKLNIHKTHFLGVSVVTALFAICSCLSTSNKVSKNDLPLVTPVFKPTAGKIVKPVLKILETSKGENPVIVAGNKRIAVREQNAWHQRLVYNFEKPNFFTVVINNKQVLKAFFTGHIPALKNYGSPFDDKEKGTLSYDEKNQSVTFSKKYHCAKDKMATYTHTLQVLDDGKIKVSWDLGIDVKTLASFKKNQFWFVPQLYVDHMFLKTGIDYNGKPVKFLLKTEFEKTEKDPKNKPLTIASGTGGVVTFAPKNPLESFKLIFGQNDDVKILEGYGKYSNGKHTLKVSIGNKIASPKGSYLIDLGECATQSSDTPPPVRGTDNWQSDRSHIPLSSTRNIMPNPSFEQDMRYWRSFSLGGCKGNVQDKEKPLYELSRDAMFGEYALKINSDVVPLNTFSIPVEKDKTYTISYYAKSLNEKGCYLELKAGSSIQTGDWLKWKRRHQKITNEWKRYSYTYKATSKAMCLILSGGNALIDGIQIEEGDKLTDFVSPPVEGVLLTSDKDNYLYLGQKINARFKLIGKPETKGTVKLDVFNYYRKNVYSLTNEFVLDKNGRTIIPLKLDPKRIGKGVFIVKATYMLPDHETYFDYYRFSIIDPLNNTHATKNLFGTNMRCERFTRSEDAIRRFMECGWGSCGSATLPVEYYDKFNITQFYRGIQKKYSPHFSKPPHPWYGIWIDWEHTSPEREKEVEELVYEAVKKLPQTKHLETAVAGEINGRQKMVMAGRYDDYIKLMLAAKRGAERANKDIIFLPDQGTSGFKPLRGYRETEEILKATAKVAPKGFKWKALAAHPYGDVDMIDERTVFFKELAKKYGHDDVPLQYTECFNIAPLYLPSWGAGSWQDSYWNGRPTYDTGWSEFTQAAQAARIFIVCLKHWPRLEHANIWIGNPYVDDSLKLTMLCGAVNTLGHLFADPEFKADIRPVDGIRSYVFKDHEGRGLVAVWSTITEVDRGYENAPMLKIKIDGELPEIIDLMGNKREYEVVNNEIVLPLSSAPLFVRGGTAESMERAFANAQVLGSNRAVKTTILPVLNGQIDATITNQTSQALNGKVTIDDRSQSFELKKSPDKVTLIVKKTGDATCGKLYKWNKKVKIELSNGGETEDEANLQYFYVPKTDKPLPLNPDASEWNKIPAINIDNVIVSKSKDAKVNAQTGQKGDSEATYQVAWDNENLYLKVTFVDDELMKPSERWLGSSAKRRNEMLYDNDACLEVYIDTAADGRSNSRKWYDDDDYRYDFYGNGPEGIYRRQEVNQQLAGGVDFLSKAEAAKTIKQKFVTKGNTATYVIIFPQVTIEPLALRKGFQAGFGLFIHDADSKDRHGLSTSTEKGEHCNYRPDRWPIMVLSDK